MPRVKKYNEEEVIEKAMRLFWRNGYETTSTRMLEREMGINQFSIYASFGNKEGILIESIKFYKRRLKSVLNKLENSSEGIIAIKQYFYDVLDFTRENNIQKGCLLSNTVSEIGSHIKGDLKNELRSFRMQLRDLFIQKLKTDTDKTSETIEKQANYLIIAISGLTTASKTYEKQFLIDYIETTFDKL